MTKFCTSVTILCWQVHEHNIQTKYWRCHKCYYHPQNVLFMKIIVIEVLPEARGLSYRPIRPSGGKQLDTSIGGPANPFTLNIRQTLKTYRFGKKNHNR